MKQNRGRYKQSGFTLVEMLVAIAIGSSIMLTAVSLVHRAFELRSATQALVQHTSTLNRFTEQFRRDVHLATRVEATQASLTVDTADGESIHYVAGDHWLTRERTRGDRRQTERVGLSENSSARFSIEELPLCAVLTVERWQDSGEARIVRNVVVAVGLLADTRAGSTSNKSSAAETVEGQP